MLTVPLHGRVAAGRLALIDDEDWDLVSGYRWYVWETLRPGLRPNGPYARAHAYRGGRRIVLRMHTLITGWVRVDHADGNGLNNQRANLRPATLSQNGANRRKQEGCSSRFKGVSWHQGRRRWVAQIRIDGKRYCLGRFVDEESAARAYDAAALAAWGEFAYLNFPSRPPVRSGCTGRPG